ncbi:hypothetical protein AB0F17_44300 [Nonomuraea sp. NPDC026600]|uniref:hypothetical protein n=1 Tax=Nonomuraea sp. NPDC026600 TaxID=3155363 RepID=UPI0033F12FBA
MFPDPLTVPRPQLAAHLEDLLFFLYGGQNLPHHQHALARQGIQAFADSAPNQSVVIEQAKAQQIDLAHIKQQALQLAGMMDLFFGGYNVAWDGKGNYGFVATQGATWGIPAEDINSTRKYCVLQENRIEQMLSNLLNLLKRLRRPL